MLRLGIRTYIRKFVGVPPPIGLMQERDRWQSQYDVAVGERNELRRQIDVAVGERNEFMRQVSQLGRSTIRRLVPDTAEAADLRRLVFAIESVVDQPSPVFFRAVDLAREKFRASVLSKGEIEHALLGIKLINLMVAKHEYLGGHIKTTARPTAFMLDPANQCQLGCSTCINTTNTAWADTAFKPRPMGVMKEPIYRSFINENGMAAFSGHFYNFHEPLLNKQTPTFLRTAADLRIETFISSNMSFPKIDAEAIVASGLKELMVAADGVTQDIYGRYRRGGNIEWVLANARAIAEAKIKLGSSTPRLRWQYLTFEHNLHEIPTAIDMARDIGFDAFNLATAYDVSADDSSIRACEYPGGPESMAQVFRPVEPFAFTGDLKPYAEAIEARLSEGAEARWSEQTGGVDQTAVGTDRCDWLYLATTIDGAGRVFPCCIPDHAGDWDFQFGALPAESKNLMNAPKYQAARMALVDPERLTAETGGARTVRCHGCSSRPRPQVGLGAVHGYLENIPEFAGMPFLYSWSSHRNPATEE